MNPQIIKQTVQTYFNIDLSIKSSLREYVYPKSILCYLLRENKAYSLSISKQVTGFKSNRSIVYHYETVKANIKINKSIKKDLEEIEKLLKLHKY